MSQLINPPRAGHIIEEEGTPLTQRKNLNFIGSTVTVTDNSGADATEVTITSVQSRAFGFFT